MVRRVPDARYIILHTMTGNVSDEVAGIFKSADIVFDTARFTSVPVNLGSSSVYIPNVIKKYGKEKIAFGTATPFMDYVTPLIRIEALPDNEVSDTVKNLIRSGNAMRILGL